MTEKLPAEEGATAGQAKRITGELRRLNDAGGAQDPIVPGGKYRPNSLAR